MNQDGPRPAPPSHARPRQGDGADEPAALSRTVSRSARGHGWPPSRGSWSHVAVKLGTGPGKELRIVDDFGGAQFLESPRDIFVTAVPCLAGQALQSAARTRSVRRPLVPGACGAMCVRADFWSER